MNNWGYETKEVENQSRLKSFNINFILTYNACITSDLTFNFQDF